MIPCRLPKAPGHSGCRPVDRPGIRSDGDYVPAENVPARCQDPVNPLNGPPTT
jgi:hypothetical protein